MGADQSPNHNHSHNHSHDHGASLARAGERYRKPLLISFLIIFAFFVVEAVGGLVTGSLALLSDAGHMLTDVIGLGMALAAIQLASTYGIGKDGIGDNDSSSRHTFGLYRLEILAAFVNALLLFGVAIWVLIEAVRRLFGDPELLSTQMLMIATLGLLANIAAFLLLRQGSKESINIEGAYLEVLADTIGSVGVIAVSIIIKIWGWTWVDPVLAALIGLWILPRTYRLGKQAVNILLQAAPEGFDVDELATALKALPDVIDVHDVHVWTLTSDMNAASAHMVTSNDADLHQVLDAAQRIVTDQYHIDHGTFQVEPESHVACHKVAW